MRAVTLFASSLVGLGLALWAWGCGPSSKVERDSQPRLRIDEEIQHLVRARGASLGLTDTVGMERTWDQLAELYAERHHRPVWSNGRRARRQAHQLLDAIRRTEEAGLEPSDYDIEHLASLLAQAGRTSEAVERARPRTMARFDLLATYSFLRVVGHLREGRVPRAALDPDWVLDTLDSDRVKRTLGQDPSDFFANREPSHDGYRRLRTVLARYRAISASGGWPEVPAGPLLKLGARDPRVPLLVRRLVIGGDFRMTGGDTVFDHRLERAIGNLQARLGIPVSGLVGEATRAALNVPVEQRIRQIELNLERWRWLPDELGRRLVEVNIPAYRLSLIQDGRITRSMRVVVGRRRSPTPVFSDRITYLEVNPTWTLPPSVVEKEIVQALKRDRDYLGKNHMRVVSIADAKRDTVDPGKVPWKLAASDSFPYLVIQEAGPANPLGSIKLMCPNEYDVYLHDTPVRSRFSVAVRDYSHGCVRIEHAIELADSLMRRQPEDTLQLDSLAALGSWKRIRLPEPVPVHFLYWTAWVDSAGRLNYRDDLYGLDQRLDEALRNRRARDLVVNPGVEISPFWAASEARMQRAAAVRLKESRAAGR